MVLFLQLGHCPGGDASVGKHAALLYNVPPSSLDLESHERLGRDGLGGCGEIGVYGRGLVSTFTGFQSQIPGAWISRIKTHLGKALPARC